MPGSLSQVNSSSASDLLAVLSEGVEIMFMHMPFAVHHEKDDISSTCSYVPRYQAQGLSFPA